MLAQKKILTPDVKLIGTPGRNVNHKNLWFLTSLLLFYTKIFFAVILYSDILSSKSSSHNLYGCREKLISISHVSGKELFFQQPLPHTRATVSCLVMILASQGTEVLFLVEYFPGLPLWKVLQKQEIDINKPRLLCNSIPGEYVHSLRHYSLKILPNYYIENWFGGYSKYKAIIGWYESRNCIPIPYN